MSDVGFDLGWLDDVDEEFKLGGKPEDLTDGEYDFTIRDAKVKNLAAKSKLIIELKLDVLTAGKHQGHEIQHTLYISDKDSAVRVGRDLKTLGFDCDNWTRANDRPFSQEIMKIGKVLRGLMFKGKKQTNKGTDGRTFHNLYIQKRLASDGKPTVLGPAELDAADPENDDPFG